MLIAFAASLSATAVCLAAAEQLRNARASWWPLLGDLRLSWWHRAALTLRLVAPALVAVTAGMVVAGASAVLAFDDATMWETRLLFAVPGVLAVVVLRSAVLLEARSKSAR